MGKTANTKSKGKKKGSWLKSSAINYSKKLALETAYRVVDELVAPIALDGSNETKPMIKRKINTKIRAFVPNLFGLEDKIIKKINTKVDKAFSTFENRAGDELHARYNKAKGATEAAALNTRNAARKKLHIKKRENKASLRKKCYFYPEINYQGAPLGLYRGKYDVDFLKKKGFNNKIASIKVPQGYLVKFWEQAHFVKKRAGFYGELTHNVKNLSIGWHKNKISSFIIEKMH